MTRPASLIVDSPIGPLLLSARDGALTALEWLRPGDSADDQEPSDVLAETAAQLDAYFRGRLLAFDVALGPSRTPHAAAIRRALTAIPPGQTRTYGEIARDIGSSPRAVGQGCRTNPIAVIVPCHRVVASTGIGGFAGATDGRPIDRKHALLDFETSGRPIRAADFRSGSTANPQHGFPL